MKDMKEKLTKADHRDYLMHFRSAMKHTHVMICNCDEETLAHYVNKLDDLIRADRLEKMLAAAARSRL